MKTNRRKGAQEKPKIRDPFVCTLRIPLKTLNWKTLYIVPGAEMCKPTSGCALFFEIYVKTHKHKSLLVTTDNSFYSIIYN